jgi:hypothetical protein
MAADGHASLAMPQPAAALRQGAQTGFAGMPFLQPGAHMFAGPGKLPLQQMGPQVYPQHPSNMPGKLFRETAARVEADLAMNLMRTHCC